MSEKARTLVLSSLVGDALSLGVHWIYDPAQIERQFGRVDKLLAPAFGSFHAGKQAGDFTHYGDQTMVLLESVAATDGFDLEDFATRWKNLFSAYKGYVDKATRGTLARFESGATPETSGSDSRDLAGASRIAPLVAALRDSPDALVQAVRAQTAMTHANSQVVEAAEFFARLCLETMQGTAPRAALENLLASGRLSDSLSEWVRAGLDSADQDTIQAIQNLGPTCHVDQALPGAVHCIAKYENAPAEALIQCIMAGGDSSARGMLVSLVLLSWPENNGLASFPAQWVQGLRKAREIDGFCERLS